MLFLEGVSAETPVSATDMYAVFPGKNSIPDWFETKFNNYVCVEGGGIKTMLLVDTSTWRPLGSICCLLEIQTLPKATFGIVWNCVPDINCGSTFLGLAIQRKSVFCMRE